jgi:predicted XRE-type DNA-binding protein
MEEFESVWDAIEPAGRAAHMRARSECMMAVLRQIDKLELTPAGAAERLGVSRSRVYELRAGKLSLFSLDRLIEFAAALGLRVELSMHEVA